ncbi:aminoglycoside phosphotransferase family protein [Streptomyces sp. NPDC093589]|uniref:aminoglycoside phosphotransferase family protein n=1 Tax=Streptomyces sp. NPDC093589 TaxID=3366043 RepID=UPI0038260F1F
MELGLPFGDGLQAVLGEPRSFRRLSSSPRSRVWRVELDRGPVVVKQIVGGADAGERYAREVAALRLAWRAEVPVVPAVLGTEAGERVLVLRHLEHRRPSGDWIVGYAEALARLHACAGPEVVDVLPRWAGPDEGDVGSFLRLAEALEASVGSGVEAELHALTGRLGRASGQALLHGDPCPGNDLHTADGVRFVDFEQASWGSGLMELAYLRIGFPTCWCVTAASASRLSRAEGAYLAAWRAATGSDGWDGAAVREGLVEACAGWLIRGDALVQRAHRDGRDHLARIPDEDWEWGTVSARQRLAHRLGVVGRMAAGHPALEGLGALSREMRRRMLARWPRIGPVPAERP